MEALGNWSRKLDIVAWHPRDLSTRYTSCGSVLCHLEIKELTKETAQNQRKNAVREANHRGVLRTQARVLECSCHPSTGQPRTQHSMLPKAALNASNAGCRVSKRAASTAASSDHDKTPSLFPLPKQHSQISSRGHNPEDEARNGGIYLWYSTQRMRLQSSKLVWVEL